MANYQSTKTGAFIEAILTQFAAQKGNESTPIYLAGGGTASPGTFQPVENSYVGMVIFSTTLDTESKVKAFYGGEGWLQHSGCFLYGATTGVTAGVISPDGGTKDAIVVDHTHTFTTGNQSANHTHTATVGTQDANHTHSFSGTTGNNNASHYHGTGSSEMTHFTLTVGSITDDEGSAISGSGYDFPRRAHSSSNTWGGKVYTGTQSANHAHTYSGTTGNQSASHKHSVTLGNQSASHHHSGTTDPSGIPGNGANMPPYKNVYIWERIA